MAQGNASLFEEISTGTYYSNSYEKYYKITLAEDGNIFFKPTGFSGLGPYIYNKDLELVGEMSLPIDHLSAGEYYLQTKFSSTSSAEASLYIPSAASYEGLPELRTGEYPEPYYNNFHSLTLSRGGNITISPQGDSASFTIYDKALNTVLDGYGVNGPIYLSEGEYILHTSYNASPSRTQLSVYIPEELLTPSNDEVTVPNDTLSAVFDDAFYLSEYSDIAAAGVNPLEHFLNYGWKEGRDPSVSFDTSWYLEQNPDVAAAGINPVEHFVNHGWKEGRDPSASFDTSWYLEQNPDVAAAGINPVEHFESHGWKEGRDPSVSFDTSWYLAQNPDVASAGINPLEHFENYGWKEGRQPTPEPTFELSGYASYNSFIEVA